MGWEAGWRAASGSITAGSSSYSTVMRRTAASAIARLSATTAAIRSPQKRTWSVNRVSSLTTSMPSIHLWEL